MKYYAISGFDRTATISVMGTTKKLELSWVEGQVGAIPIFENKTLALKYAKKHGHTVIEFESQETTKGEKDEE